MGLVISGLFLTDKCLLPLPHTAMLTPHILSIVGFNCFKVSTGCSTHETFKTTCPRPIHGQFSPRMRSGFRLPEMFPAAVTGRNVSAPFLLGNRGQRVL